MHSIERYGIVALLFLVVTVVAVLMWDGGKDKKKADPAGATANAAAARERAEERRAARRLSLAAESQPGPLARQSNPPAGESGTQPPPEASDPAPLTAPLDPGNAEVRPPAAGARRTLTPPEEPSREALVGQAPAASTHAYTVRSGDTLSEISQRELGSARRWQEIVAANPGLDPARLRAGKTIQIPGAARTRPGEAKPQAAPPSAARTTWKVGKGENLWKIAERALGDGKRWPEIAALNPRVKPDRLLLGQVLTLPAATPGKQASAGKPAADRPTLVASSGGERLPQRGGRVR